MLRALWGIYASNGGVLSNCLSSVKVSGSRTSTLLYKQSCTDCGEPGKGRLSFPPMSLQSRAHDGLPSNVGYRYPDTVGTLAAAA